MVNLSLIGKNALIHFSILYTYQRRQEIVFFLQNILLDLVNHPDLQLGLKAFTLETINSYIRMVKQNLYFKILVRMLLLLLVLVLVESVQHRWV